MMILRILLVIIIIQLPSLKIPMVWVNILFQWVERKQAVEEAVVFLYMLYKAIMKSLIAEQDLVQILTIIQEH